MFFLSPNLRTHFFYATLVSILSFTTVLKSEDGEAASLNHVAIDFPSPNANFSNGLILNTNNYEKYQDLILPEWRELLKVGLYQFDAFSKLPITIATGLNCCLANKQSDLQISDNGSVVNFSKISNEKFFQIDSDFTGQTENQLKLNGYKILWNLVNIWQNFGYINSPLNIKQMQSGSIAREMSADYSMIFPKQVLGNDKTAQVFRTKLVFHKPELIKHFSWLQFRFFEEDEDALFVYSPVIKKNRELTGANTSDNILGTALALDDILVFTQKIDSLHVKGIEQGMFFMPLVLLKGQTKQQAKGECSQVNSNSEDSNESLLWNYQSNRFASGAAWIPSEAISIPRKMYRLHLETKDPYHLYGQQILYIDIELGLPIAKVVYDVSGKLWKTVLGIYAFPTNADSIWRYAPEAQVILDYSKNEATLVRYENFKFCNNSFAEKEILNFAPKKILEQAGGK
jgi:hypothetical protein